MGVAKEKSSVPRREEDEVLCATLEANASFGEPRCRVDCVAPGWVDLEVKVGASGPAAGAHAGDALAGADGLADGALNGLHVAVHGDGAVLVADADPVAVATCRASVDHNAVRDGQDWGANSVGDVDPLVERPPARSEAGGVGAFSGLYNEGSAGGQVSGDAFLVVLNSLPQLFSEVVDRLVLADG